MAKRGPKGRWKYKSTYPEELIQMMEQGMLDCEIFAEWSISKDQFYTWRREIEAMEHAFQIGLPKCEAWWTRKMRECFLKGDDKGFKYCIAIMNNKFGWEKGTKSGEGNTTNININNMNVLQQLGRDGLIKDIQLQLEKHKDIIDVRLLEESSQSEQPDGQGTPQSS